MESIKLFDGEMKLMELLWEAEPISAKQLSILAAEKYDWNKNTTYTVIKKLNDKNVIKRTEPNFICTSIIKKQDIQQTETQNLIEKLFNGSKKAFLSAFVQNEELSKEEIEELKKLIEDKKA
ncbi:MAG: BlaI/MecI/CopY family transcriptional regulator [Mobilitalea sp.]